MLKSGDIIKNPVLNEQVIIHTAAQDTMGTLLQLEFVHEHPTQPTPMHTHPHQEERFMVLRGTYRFVIDGHTFVLGAGEEIIPGLGKAHSFQYLGGEDAGHLLVEYHPALRTQDFYEMLFGLAQDRHTDGNGTPKLPWLAVWLTAYRHEFRLTGRNYWLSLVLRLLAVFFRQLGYRAPYPYPKPQTPRKKVTNEMAIVR